MMILDVPPALVARLPAPNAAGGAGYIGKTYRVAGQIAVVTHAFGPGTNPRLRNVRIVFLRSGEATIRPARGMRRPSRRYSGLMWVTPYRHTDAAMHAVEACDRASLAAKLRPSSTPARAPQAVCGAKLAEDNEWWRVHPETLSKQTSRPCPKCLTVVEGAFKAA